MGLIRKTLALGTVGIVNPRSKKQRVAAASLHELHEQTRLMQEHNRLMQEQANTAALNLARDNAPPNPAGLPTDGAAAVAREKTVCALWRQYKQGVLTAAEYEAAYHALSHRSI